MAEPRKTMQTITKLQLSHAKQIIISALTSSFYLRLCDKCKNSKTSTRTFENCTWPYLTKWKEPQTTCFANY